MTAAPRGLFNSLTVVCHNTNLYSCALAFSVPRGGEELAHALARGLFVTHYSQRLSYPANKTGRCLLNAAPGTAPDRYSLTAHPVCMLRLGGHGVSCGYSVTSCAIHLVDCATMERDAFACKGLASVTCFAGLLHLIPILCLIASSFKICQQLAYLER